MRCSYLLPLVLVTTINFCAFGQDVFGYKINVGSSWINHEVPDYIEVHQIHMALAATTGIYVGHYIGKNGYFSTELLLQQITGHSYSEYALSGTTVPRYGLSRYNFLSYVSWPLYVGFRHKQFTIATGTQASYLLRTRTKTKSEVVAGSFPQPHTYDDKASKNRFNMGFIFGLQFQLTSYIAVEASYYHALNNLQKAETNNGRNYKIRHLMLGFRFNVLQKDQ